MLSSVNVCVYACICVRQAGVCLQLIFRQIEKRLDGSFLGLSECENCA